MRKLATRDRQVDLVPIKQKTIRREKTREDKALVAADVDKQVQEELMARLKAGVYEAFNYPQRLFDKNLDEQEEVERELVELDEDMYSVDMEDELGNLAFVEDDSEEETEMVVSKAKKGKKIIEYEDDEEMDLALA